jgi:hypothetical protein
VTIRSARLWHGLTAVVAITALVLQLVLVLQGGRVLDETEPDPLRTRLWHLVSYFTIQSNVLVAVAVVLLTRDPARDGSGFRSLRLAGTIGIAVTGLVHFFLLRPLLDLDGADYVADKLLHRAVPVVAFVGWVVLGPRPRVDRPAAVWSVAWPLAYLGYVLVVGAASGWYPYPFLDVDEKGWGHVLVAAAGITVLFLAFIAAATAFDRRARPQPEAWDPYRNPDPDPASPTSR